MDGKKVLLMILDGWGHGPKPEASAIAQAKTPFVDSLYSNYPNTELRTDGDNVGLPFGQMGNSEVGHMNIGAGRVVYQDLLRINNAIETNELKDNPVLNNAYTVAKENKKPIHFFGLVSDGGIHSHINHLLYLVNYAVEQGVQEIYIHAFTDGRDTDPMSGELFIRHLQKETEGTPAKIATVIGRYYAMDRDRRWERIKLAYDMLLKGEGYHSTDPVEAIKKSYSEGVTDEFIKPIVVTDNGGAPVGLMKSGDITICFNFRTDRCRQITRVLVENDMPEEEMFTLPLYYITLTNYDERFKKVQVILTNDKLKNTIGEVLAAHGKLQIRIAETEKYPHVTFFFSGGRELPFEGENRIMISSPKVATYDLKPEMSAYEVRDALIPELEKGTTDFICLNFANPDMVGHTGIFEAAIKAVETVDSCAHDVATAALQSGYTVIITADHGNADYMINEDGSPNTAHTTNPVPVFLLDNTWKPKLKPGKLADLAPTILHRMGVEIPKEMTGKILTAEA